MRSSAAFDMASRASRPSFASASRSLLPTGAFLVFDGWLGLAAGMIAASITTVILLVLRRRGSAGVGILLPVSLAFVVVRAIAGVLTESQVVYFGGGLALSAVISIAIGATAFTKQPVASYAMPLVTPYRHLSLAHPVYRRVAAQGRRRNCPRPDHHQATRREDAQGFTRRPHVQRNRRAAGSCQWQHQRRSCPTPPHQ